MPRPLRPSRSRQLDRPAGRHRVESADQPELPPGHLAVQPPPAACPLDAPRAGDPLGNDGCVLGLIAGHEGRRLHPRHRDPQVDPVTEWPGHPTRVALRHARTAAAPAGVVAGQTAWARVHRRDELEAGRERRCAADPGDRDATLLERLAESLQHVPRELRQFVEEQDAVIGQCHLPRRHPWPAAHHRRVRQRVVGSPDRGLANELARRVAGDRGDDRCRERLGIAERRQQSRDRPGEQCLAGARGPDEEQPVTAGQRDLQPAPRLELAADLGQVGHVQRDRAAMG